MLKDNNAVAVAAGLGVYMFFAILALGCSGAAFHLTDKPRPGAWYPFIFGLPAFIIGLVYLHGKYDSKGHRIAFILVGILSVLVMFIGGVIDGNYARIANHSDQCFAFNGKYNQDYCCSLKSDSYSGSVPSDSCDAAASNPTTCLCCKGPSNQSWKVKFSDCSLIPLKFAGLLGASAAFNILSGFAMAFALSFSCCKCLGGGDEGVAMPKRSRASQQLE
eukprot:c12387_g1_i1.p1 GENE.c12387_g1_i1~~c12387_g1_i1.p1  ORF type:complete len:219 (+),score=48.13 c12387_g1_i1:839-1495(+)